MKTFSSFLILTSSSFLSLFSLNVAQNACTNKADVDFWETGGGFFEFREQLRVCAIKATSSGQLNEPFIAACLLDQGMPYVVECRECFGRLSICTFDNCAESCFLDDQSPACEECAATTCNPVFFACAGTAMNPTECPQCVKPSTTIIPGLPDAAFFALISVVVVGASGSLMYYKVCKSNDDEEIEEIDHNKFGLGAQQKKSDVRMVLEAKPAASNKQHGRAFTPSKFSKESSRNDTESWYGTPTKSKRTVNNVDQVRDPSFDFEQGSYLSYAKDKRNNDVLATRMKANELDYDQMSYSPQIFTEQKSPSYRVSKFSPFTDAGSEVPPPPAGFKLVEEPKNGLSDDIPSDV